MARKGQEIIGIIGIKRILNFGMNFKDKKIVIFGLGNYRDGSGISAALFFAKENAKLVITDLKTKKELSPQLKRLRKYRNIKYVLGRHRKQDFQNGDFIFKNPSVPKDSPYLKIARKNKIPITNDWSIFFDRRPDNLLIGVTGSKGKSTTAALIYHILKIAKKDVILCGNIGQSPLALLNKITKNTIVVAELSSWSLQEFENIKKSPQIAVITNLMPDHLDKYKNIKEYFKDKENIFRFQNKNDYLILNKNDKNTKKLAEKLARRSPALPAGRLGEGGAKSRVIWYDGDPKNAAAGVAKILKIPKKSVDKALKIFKGLPGRLEFIKEIKGVKYYNDTTATMPDATIYALHQLEKTCPVLDSEARARRERSRRIILIAGGVDKKLDYKNLVNEIPKFVKALILFKGTASEKILKSLRVTGYALRKDIKSMKEAARSASKLASKNDVVLLSPGAASFNMFKNEFDRGDQFNKFVKQLK